MITLYHGSYIEVSKPFVSRGRRKVDFGQGFYLTSIRAQAVSWAKNVALRHRDGQAILGIYEFDVEDAKLECGVRYKVFNAYDLEWLDYVVDCRKGGDLQLNYDVVEGGVANDNVIDTVELYERGYITAERALDQLAYKKVDHQLCIHSQELLEKCLKFVSSEEVSA